MIVVPGTGEGDVKCRTERGRCEYGPLYWVNHLAAGRQGEHGSAPTQRVCLEGILRSVDTPELPYLFTKQKGNFHKGI